jgi:lipopolysaccharide biosynthesis glycosyltransferase
LSKWKVHVFILTENLDSENREKLTITFNVKSRELRHIEVHDHEFDRLHVYVPWTASMSYRPQIPTLLKGYSKVICLDADTVAEGDIGKLFDIHLQDKFLAAVYEFDLNESPAHFQIQRVGTPLENGYFNRRVLLLNLEQMCPGNFEEQCRSRIFSEKRHRLTLPDQDALNIVANRNYLHLPPI